MEKLKETEENNKPKKVRSAKGEALKYKAGRNTEHSGEMRWPSVTARYNK